MAERMARGCALLFGLAALLGFFGAAPAQACDASNQQVFGISPGCIDMRISAPPEATNLAPDYFQAGGHPYAVVSTFRLNAPAAAGSTHGEYWPPESLRDLRLSLPSGLAANLASTPVCSMEQLKTSGAGEAGTNCPTDSQIGVVAVHASVFLLETIELPLYMVEPPPGVPARFGFNVAGSASVFDAELGPGGELSMHASKMSQFLSFIGLEVALWGVPADLSHDPQRACTGQNPPTRGLFGVTGPSCTAGVPPSAFLRLPTSCAEPATMSVQVDSWAHPEVFHSRSVSVHRSPGLLGDPAAIGSYPAPYPGLAADQWGPAQAFTGCGQAPFSPSMSVRPDSSAADSPTGLDVEVSLPQQGFADPNAVSEADLESGTFTLPVGLSLNPAVANGLSACTPEEVDLGSSSAARCPDSSKLGTVELTTPVLPMPLTGSIYSAKAGKGGSGETTLPTYLVAGSGGLTLKLVSELGIGGDGQLTASFHDIPEVPISNLKFHFFGGQRAPFVTPAVCGRYAVAGKLVPRSGTAAANLSDGFEITSGAGGGACPTSPQDRPFKLGFRSAAANSIAGAETSFAVQLTRKDGEQEPRSFEFSLPPGLSASLGGVATCPDAAIAAATGREGAAEAAAPSCPAAAQVGAVAATIGAGAEPFHLQGGRVYLAGPFQGSELSFALVLPAVAGPMDLGTLAMRLPLKLDPGDGHLILAGELPALQNGARLNLRQLTIDVNRPGFLTNPTSCRASAVGGRIGGDAGASQTVSAPFQVSRCGSLGFKPRLRMKVLGGRAAVRHGAHPSLRSVLSTRPGDANFRQSKITLPGSAQLDPTHLRGVCTRAEYRADACPQDSTYGRVEVSSRLFGEPLSGLVYMRQSQGKLPSLIAALRGKVDLDLEMKLGFADGRMRLALDSLPDIPVSKLVLTTFGGRRGLFVNNRNLCEGPSYALAELVGQNEKLAKQRAKLRVPCGRTGANVTRSDDSRRP